MLLGGLTVTVSAAIVDSLHETGLLFRGILVVATLTAAANAFNDYKDVETDRINRQNRPLPKGDLSPSAALLWAITLFVLGISLSFSINRESFIIASFIAVPLMVAYSLWLKRTILIGNIVIAAILGLTFLFSGALFGEMTQMILPALLAFGFTLMREFIKDMADVEGDRTAGMTTFPVAFGLETSGRVATAMTILLIISLPIPYLTDIYGGKYLTTALFGIGLPLAYIISLLMKSPSSSACHTASQILKVCVFIGLMAIYLG